MSVDEQLAATAQQQAHTYIRRQVLSGDFRGGDRLNTADIAAVLGISRMPVREAIRQLDSEGLVTIRPNRGAVVTVLTPDDVEELFEMRAALESLAVRFALPNLVGESLEDLEIKLQRMDRARGDVRLWIERHNDFHDFLCQQSRRRRLTAEIDRIRTAVQPYLLMYIDVYHATEMPGYEHETLVDAIRSGNSALVELTMRDHVLRAGRGVIEFLKNQGKQQDRRSAAKRRAPAAIEGSTVSA